MRNTLKLFDASIRVPCKIASHQFFSIVSVSVTIWYKHFPFALALFHKSITTICVFHKMQVEISKYLYL